jgi:HAE1 family hydrophobic/amphiphilic exporter-1
VTFKPWGDRVAPDEQYEAIKAHINRELRQVPEGISLAFPPPAIPGVGTSGGVSFILEDRSGGEVEFLATNTKRFMDAVRKRPEIASVFSTALFSVPQFMPTSIVTRCLRKA